MPRISLHCGLFKSCLPSGERDPPAPAAGGSPPAPGSSSKCLDAARFIGMPASRRRREGAGPQDAPPPRSAVAGPSNHSGPIGRGRTALLLRQPVADTDLRLAYDTEPPQPPGTMAFFRHSGQAAELPPGFDTRGLESLQLSGSERITSAEQVRAIRQAYGDGPVVVVDLRQESHAVADGHSLTWRGTNDWGNVGLDTAATMAREAGQLEELRRQGNAVAVHAEYVKGKMDDPAPRHLATTLACSEQEIVETAGAEYRRIAVTDHMRPSRTEVDQFIELVRDLPEGTGLHVHCNGGRGRTTTFMVLYDMLRNAREVGVDAIMARQSKLGMDYNLADPGTAKKRKQLFHADRLAFLHEFHAYARENPGGLPRTWSQWRSADAAQSS